MVHHVCLLNRKQRQDIPVLLRYPDTAPLPHAYIPIGAECITDAEKVLGKAPGREAPLDGDATAPAQEDKPLPPADQAISMAIQDMVALFARRSSMMDIVWFGGCQRALWFCRAVKSQIWHMTECTNIKRDTCPRTASPIHPVLASQERDGIRESHVLEFWALLIRMSCALTASRVVYWHGLHSRRYSRLN
jgi:hypothetical protein